MILLVAAVLALGQPTPVPSPGPSILGQWESVARTQGGIGNILELRADGRVTQISVAMGEADYVVEGEWLRMFWKDPETGKISEVDTRIEFEGSDRFLEKGEDGGGDAWSERIGEPVRGQSPLIGQWCSIYLDTLTTYREFTPGRMYNRLPIQTLRGRYSISGEKLDVQIDGQPPGQYPFRLENGLLVIRSRDGSEKQYKRTECSLFRGR